MKIKLKARALAVLTICCLVSASFIGCSRYDMSVDLTKTTKEKGKEYATAQIETYFDKEKCEEFMSEFGDTAETDNSDFEIVKINGREYYKSSDIDKMMLSTKEALYTATKDSIFMYVNPRNEFGLKYGMGEASTETIELTSLFGADQLDIEDLIEKFEITFRFNNEVTKTNGKLSSDKKSVTFDLLEMMKDEDDNSYIFAYTDKARRTLDKDEKACKPKIKTLVDKKKFFKVEFMRSNKHFVKASVIPYKNIQLTVQILYEHGKASSTLEPNKPIDLEKLDSGSKYVIIGKNIKTGKRVKYTITKKTFDKYSK